MSIPDNLVIKYHSNGKIAICQEMNANGQINGICLTWYYTGVLRRISYYNNGNLDGPYQSYREDKIPWIKMAYKNGHKHGLYQTWHTSGAMWEQYYFEEGAIHGLYQSWYENGQLCEEVHYKHGNIHGLYQMWGSDGKIDHKLYYFDHIDITRQIKSVVNDIYNITDYEKTLIAVQFGYEI